jgi:hypothetical protein
VKPNPSPKPSPRPRVLSRGVSLETGATPTPAPRPSASGTGYNIFIVPVLWRYRYWYAIGTHQFQHDENIRYFCLDICDTGNNLPVHFYICYSLKKQNDSLKWWQYSFYNQFFFLLQGAFQTPSNHDAATMPPPATPLITPSRSVDVPDEASPGTGLRRQPSIRDRMKLFEQRGGSVSDTPTHAEGKRAVGSLPREMTARIEAKMDMANQR